MMLDIVVTHYKEPFKIVKPFLDILALQKGVDFNEFRVTIVHDGKTVYSPFSARTLGKYPYELRQILLKHNGVSHARNVGMDQADAEWICFCDCDDSFTDIYSLQMLFYALKTDKADMLWTPFSVERFYEDGHRDIYTSDEFNLVWTHGKYYRLSELRKHNVRFCESLSVSEDSAFNQLMYMEFDHNRVAKIDNAFPIYAWCRRPGSITTNPDNLEYLINGHFDRNLYVLRQHYVHGSQDAYLMIYRVLTDAYAMLTRKEVGPKDMIKVKKRVAQYYREREDQIQNLIKMKGGLDLMIEASEREANTSKTLNPERPSFWDWMNNDILTLE